MTNTAICIDVKILCRSMRLSHDYSISSSTTEFTLCVHARAILRVCDYPFHQHHESKRKKHTVNRNDNKNHISIQTCALCERDERVMYMYRLWTYFANIFHLQLHILRCFLSILASTIGMEKQFCFSSSSIVVSFDVVHNVNFYRNSE